MFEDEDEDGEERRRPFSFDTDDAAAAAAFGWRRAATAARRGRDDDDDDDDDLRDIRRYDYGVVHPMEFETAVDRCQEDEGAGWWWWWGSSSSSSSSMMVVDGTSSDTLLGFEESAWAVGSAAIFVASSVLYVAMACMDTYSWYEEDDDYDYDDDYDDDDDVVATMSAYAVLYFWAAFGFLITGLIEIALARDAPLAVRSLYHLMVLAAVFGLASAVLADDDDPTWSDRFDCASTNLWAVEGGFVVFRRCLSSSSGRRTDDDDDGDDGDRVVTARSTTTTSIVCGVSERTLLTAADVSFAIGTFGDAFTSWMYVLGRESLSLDASTVAFASMWQICAVAYLVVAVRDHHRQEEENEDEDEDGGNPLRRRLLLG